MGALIISIGFLSGFFKGFYSRAGVYGIGAFILTYTIWGVPSIIWSLEYFQKSRGLPKGHQTGYHKG